MRPIEPSAPPLLRTRRGLMFTALPAIAVLAVLGALLALQHRASSRDDRLRETRELARAAAANARGYLDDQYATLGAIAASPTVRTRATGLRRYLHDLVDVTRFDSLALLDAGGRTFESTVAPPGAPPVDLSDRVYVQRALDGEPGVSDALESRLTRRPIVAFSYPVQAPTGGLGGVLTAAIRLDIVSDGLAQLLFLEGSGATIVDGGGNLVTAPGLRLRPAPEGYPVEEMRRAGAGVEADVETEAGERVLGFVTLPQTGWLVVVDRRRAEVLGPLDRALFAELAALALLTALGVAITFAAARRLDRLDARRDEALAQQREIALQLQHSLLPELRTPAALAVHAGYVPAQGTMAVGGDWYDLIDVGDGLVVLSMGDVAGHGLGAAAAMGKLRSAARSAALLRSPPAEALGHLDRFASLLDGRPLATVVYATLDVARGRLRWATAGHPPPLLLRADGTTTFLEGGRSPLLGVGTGTERRPEATASLAPGDTLVLYTDGVVERPEDPIDHGLARLAELSRSGEPDPAALVARVLAAVPEPRRDDAAVLAVRLEGAAAPAAGAV